MSVSLLWTSGKGLSSSDFTLCLNTIKDLARWCLWGGNSTGEGPPPRRPSLSCPPAKVHWLEWHSREFWMTSVHNLDCIGRRFFKYLVPNCIRLYGSVPPHWIELGKLLGPSVTPRIQELYVQIYWFLYHAVSRAAPHRACCNSRAWT